MLDMSKENVYPFLVLDFSGKLVVLLFNSVLAIGSVYRTFIRLKSPSLWSFSRKDVRIFVNSLFFLYQDDHMEVGI